MGNRAVLTDEKRTCRVYLHWNGGPDSISAFLTYCKRHGYRSPESDEYGWARLLQVIGNFFGGGMSLGMSGWRGTISSNDPGDNGVYVIGRDWSVVEHHGPVCHEGYDLAEMLHEIDERMPEREQLGAFLDAVEVPTPAVEVGDTVWVPAIGEGGWEPFEVVGFGEDGRKVNGSDVGGKPYFARYSGMVDPRDNPNNYITEPTCWVTRKEARNA